MAEDTKAITEDRGRQYGDYQQQAALAQELKQAMRDMPEWDTLPSPFKESLEMIQLKISRIICGNSLNLDSWRDIEGYAYIARRDLEKK